MTSLLLIPIGAMVLMSTACGPAPQAAAPPKPLQEALEKTLEQRLRLAYLRYSGGVDTQLNALDADRDFIRR